MVCVGQGEHPGDLNGSGGQVPALNNHDAWTNGFIALKADSGRGTPAKQSGSELQKEPLAPAVYQPSDGAQVASQRCPILR